MTTPANIPGLLLGGAYLAAVMGEAPNWITASGMLAQEPQGTPLAIQLDAEHPLGATYALVADVLPSGLTLSPDGLISGVLSETGYDTSYTFTIRATSYYGVSADREFTITVQAAP